MRIGNISPLIRKNILWMVIGYLSFLYAQSNVDSSRSVGDGEELLALRILQIQQDTWKYRSVYPEALPSLLQFFKEVTGASIDPVPVVLPDFSSREIFRYPFIYVNAVEREDWTFSPREVQNLREYLERGGFIFIDSGITAAFLREDPLSAQHHSFAEWEVSPLIGEAFQQVFPEKKFHPVAKNHPIFRSFYQGLPDASILPETVREYVVKEKWPEGTYSLVALHVRDRIAVLCSPILAMGWGRDTLGMWRTNIGFRILESAPNLEERLETIAYAKRYSVKREDGQYDMIYCLQPTLPAWIYEAEGRWRIFRYYHSREINEFAHQFYTRLGVNILFYAMLH